jgi:hypothetical protein
MTGELTKAHCQFLDQIGKIEEKGVNPFHKSNYATLEGVLSVVNPVLAANGLSVNQIFDYTEDGRTVLKTHLKHISGEEVVSSALYPETPGNKNKLHDWGGNCTYMRRYTLLAILGICAGIEDTDGNHAQEELPQKQEFTKRPNDAWRNTSTTSSNIHTHPKQEIPVPVAPEDRQSIIADLTSLYMTNKTRFGKFEDEYRAAFPDCEKGQLLSEHIQTQKQADFVMAWFIKNGPPSP